jgi:hypothetical protein
MSFLLRKRDVTEVDRGERAGIECSRCCSSTQMAKSKSKLFNLTWYFYKHIARQNLCHSF